MIPLFFTPAPEGGGSERLVFPFCVRAWGNAVFGLNCEWEQHSTRRAAFAVEAKFSATKIPEPPSPKGGTGMGLCYFLAGKAKYTHERNKLQSMANGKLAREYKDFNILYSRA